MQPGCFWGRAAVQLGCQRRTGSVPLSDGRLFSATPPQWWGLSNAPVQQDGQIRHWNATVSWFLYRYVAALFLITWCYSSCDQTHTSSAHTTELTASFVTLSRPISKAVTIIRASSCPRVGSKSVWVLSFIISSSSAPASRWLNVWAPLSGFWGWKRCWTETNREDQQTHTPP